MGRAWQAPRRVHVVLHRRYRRVPVDQRLTKIVTETGRYRITGLLRLPPEGYRSRLSDYLNAPERAFLSLTDVEIKPLDGDGPAEQMPFMALSVAHVVFVAHADDVQ